VFRNLSLHTSVESLAASINVQPKVVRKNLRLAFLAPEIIEAVMLGRHPKSLTLSDLQQAVSLSWVEQRQIGNWSARRQHARFEL
jgi:site-specific DNA recombinase